MRRLLGTMCAVALVACSDSKAPTVTSPTAPVKPPAGPFPDSTGNGGLSLDPRSIPDRIADLVSARFASVALPTDVMSKSPDAVHPDIACRDGGWNGNRCWLLYTPYLNSNNTFENPAFVFAASDTSWTTPPAIANPIVPYPGVGAYNSDPDQAFDPVTHRLTQIYRVVNASENQIMIMSTMDARNWTPARVAFKEANHDAISPSLIINDDRSADVWYVRSGVEGCNSRSSTVVKRRATPDDDDRLEKAPWSAPVAVNLSIPNYVVWHLDIAKVRDGYVGLIVAYPKVSNCAAADLWLATSPDGINWTSHAMPMFWRGMNIARSRNISTWYRGTLRYDAATDSLDVWPSALAGSRWTIYHTAMKYSDINSLLTLASPADLRAIAARQGAIRATIEMP